MQYMDIVKMAKERKRGNKRTEEADDPQRGRLQPPKYGLAAKADPAKRPRKGQSQSSSSQAAASSQPVPSSPPSTVPGDTVKDIDDSLDESVIKANPAVTFDPIKCTGDQLDPLFETKKRNFVTYWDPATNDVGDLNKDNRTMVRANCKFDPNDTKIKLPPRT